MKTSEVEWLLRGKLFCGHCGTQMTGDSGTGRANEKHYYYTCHKRKRYKDCDKKSEKKEQLERAVCQKTVEYVKIVSVILRNESWSSMRKSLMRR